MSELKTEDKVVRAWAYGGGWDSTAGIIKDVLAGRRIDLIAFADHGGEKRYPDPEAGEEVGTYDFLVMFDDWLKREGYPSITYCRYQPKPQTAARYEQATRDVVTELGLMEEIGEDRIPHLAGIYGNSVANSTLPGLAFNMKSCSVKHKLQALEFT